MFFNESQSRIVFLTNHKADIVLSKRICPALQILFVIKNLKGYLVHKSSQNKNILLQAVMKLKTQIKIYQKLVSELGGKYDGAEEFINIRVKELCLEHGILEEEVQIYFYAAYTV